MAQNVGLWLVTKASFRPFRLCQHMLLSPTNAFIAKPFSDFLMNMTGKATEPMWHRFHLLVGRNK